MTIRDKSLTNMQLAHQARREQGDRTRAVFERIVLEASEPMTVVEVIETAITKTGTKFSYEHARLVLAGLVVAGRLSSRTETIDERNIRLGITGDYTFKPAILYWRPDVEVPARTTPTTVDGRLYRTSQEKHRKSKKKKAARANAPKIETGINIDSLIKELSSLAEWKKRALEAEAKLAQLSKIVGH